VQDSFGVNEHLVKAIVCASARPEGGACSAGLRRRRLMTADRRVCLVVLPRFCSGGLAGGRGGAEVGGEPFVAT